jgi:uncharacterized protein
MPDKIFITLPVADVAKSRAFYQALGWAINENFSTATSACFEVCEAISLMVATQDRVQSLSPKPLILPSTGAMSLISLSCVSRAEVDTLTEAAVTAGGRALHDPEDLGFMYSRAFEDLDGNGFGVFWMNPTAAAD